MSPTPSKPPAVPFRAARWWPRLQPRRPAVAALALALAALGQAAPASAATTPNLLVNGDAETHRCTDDWTGQTSVPGWTVLRGAASVLCYRAFDRANAAITTPDRPAAGKALFAAPGADTAMEQRVDLSPASRAIDAGGVRFSLSGWLGGWQDRPERASLTATFLDQAGRATRPPVVLADAGAAARGGATALLERRAGGEVPAGTRGISVTLQFLSGMASYHNAYADNIRLRLMAHGQAHGQDLASLAARTPSPPPSSVPAFDHVVVVMMENTNYADVVRPQGSSVAVDAQMPYLASLARRGVLLSNAWQTYHPSDQNYVAMVAGDTFKQGPVYFPDYDLRARHLGDLLEARGKRWRAYVQDMGSPCNLESTGHGRQSFSPDDEPFVHFHNVIAQPERCAASLRDLKDLAADAASHTLPDFAWVAANNWWDGEGAWEEARDVPFSNAKQDRFLRQTLQPLLASPAWQDSRSLLIITWDESNGWGWPDNHVPTLFVASAGLLAEGSVIHQHASGYDLLRTVESALRVGDLGRFDTWATPLDAVFSGRPADDPASALLWPAESAATRGSLADTFGRAGTPASAVQGQALKLVVPAGAGAQAYVNLEPVGTVPGAGSKRYPFDPDGARITLPTGALAPGFYAAWLRQADEPAAVAPLMVQVLPDSTLSPVSPGLEILGAEAPGAPEASGTPEASDGPRHRLSLREGANPIVRYCLPAGVPAQQGWIGIFPEDTPPQRMTKAYANRIGWWLKTPAGQGAQGQCGEAQAYAAELAPKLRYRALLFVEQADQTSTAVGRSVGFSVIQALAK